MTTSRWTSADMPDLAGRTVIVTGASAGIGLVTARELARAGASVVLAVRNRDRGRAAAASMPGRTEVRELDLADLDSVRAFADAWDRPVDVLVNNAGVMAVPAGRTVDGFELQIATNHLGPFALTGLLLDRITDRVVAVSSTAHRGGRVRLDDLCWERGYKPWAAYAQSKLANLLFTSELQRRLDAAGSSVRAVAAHPGWAATELQSRTGNRLLNATSHVLNRLLAQSADAGAWPTLYAATQDLPGDSYVGPSGIVELRGHPRLVGRSAAARDAAMAATLWDLSERLTGVVYALPPAAAA